MKEWNVVYRDLLAAQNMMNEAIATAKTLHERDMRLVTEIKEDGNMWKARAEAAERRVAELEAQLEEQAARLSGIEGACDIFEDLMWGGTDE